jgi:transposase
MIPSDQHMSEPVARRMEVFAGAGHRREWPAELKARILAETTLPGETVSGVARRHGLRVNQLFLWRKAPRCAAERQAQGRTESFVPVVVNSPSPTAAAPATPGASVAAATG